MCVRNVSPLIPSFLISVVFMYPEYAETDFIEEFVEDQAFEDHLVKN
jgi:hypothetical protein